MKEQGGGGDGRERGGLVVSDVSGGNVKPASPWRRKRGHFSPPHLGVGVPSEEIWGDGGEHPRPPGGENLSLSSSVSLEKRTLSRAAVPLFVLLTQLGGEGKVHPCLTRAGAPKKWNNPQSQMERSADCLTGRTRILPG